MPTPLETAASRDRGSALARRRLGRRGRPGAGVPRGRPVLLLVGLRAGPDRSTPRPMLRSTSTQRRASSAVRDRLRRRREALRPVRRRAARSRRRRQPDAQGVALASARVRRSASRVVRSERSRGSGTQVSPTLTSPWRACSSSPKPHARRGSRPTCERLARWLWTPEWEAELRDLTQHHGPERAPAKKLLESIDRPSASAAATGPLTPQGQRRSSGARVRRRAL